jgi:hypothetical protein
MTLVSRLIPVNNRMSRLADRLGIPQYADVVLKLDSGVFVPITPRPLVKSLSKGNVIQFQANTVTINKDDLWIEGVPQTYDPDVLANCIIIVDAVPLGQGYVGLNTKCEYIDRNDTLTFKILVKKLRAR